MGFIQGTTAANQTIAQDRAQRQESRQEKQQRLNNYIKGFEIDPATGQYTTNARGQVALDTQTEQLKQQLEVLRAQNEAIQATMNKDTMTDSIITMMRGDIQGGWKKITQNPGLYQKLKEKGVEEVQPVDWLNDKQLLAKLPALQSLTPEQLADPVLRKALNSAFYKSKRNGKWHLSTTEDFYRVTGTHQYIDSSTQAGIEARLNRIGEILKLKVTTPYEQKLKELQTRNAISQQEQAAMVNKITIGDMERFMQENPDATLKEFKEYMASMDANPENVYKTEKAKYDAEKAKYDAQKAKDEAGLGGNFPRNEFFSILDAKTQEYGGEGPLFENELWNLAKREQGKNKVDVTMNSNIVQRIDIMSSIRDVKKEFEDLDKNAWETVKTGLAKILPNNWVDLSEEEKNKLYKRIKADSKLGGTIANYIKMMSGAAVTDSERKTFTDIIASNQYATKEAFLAALEGFTESLDTSTKNIISGTKTLTPYSYMNYMEMLAKNGFIGKQTQQQTKPDTVEAIVDQVNTNTVKNTETTETVPKAEDYWE